ncbi:MAG: hypothetical protein N3E37_04105 [Candidatus Micrarchaeota archaeon]|nr:hypothetical protein [Candidatus Micrarchaeota archaeon]
MSEILSLMNFVFLINISTDVTFAIFSIHSAAIMLMILIIGIVYMIGKATNNQQYIAFAKMELYQLVITVLLLLFGIGVIFFFDELMKMFSCGLLSTSSAIPNCHPINLSMNYLDLLLFDKTYGAVEKGYELKKMNLQYEATAAFGQRVAYTGWGLKKGIEIPRALGMLGMALTNGLYTAFTIFVPSLYLQRYILASLDLLAFAIILPVGLVLRTFPPTRSGGTFLIALGIGLKTIFVFTYVMHFNTVIRFMIPKSIQYENVIPTGTVTYGSGQDTIRIPNTSMLSDIEFVQERVTRQNDLGPYYTQFDQQHGVFRNVLEKLKGWASNFGISYTYWDLFSTPQSIVAIYGVLVFLQRIATESTVPGGVKTAAVLSQVFRSVLYGATLYEFLYVNLYFIVVPQTIYVLSWLILQGIFLPALSFVITSTFINVLHRFLMNLTS